VTWGVAVRVAEPGELDRLWALARVVRREAEYLAQPVGFMLPDGTIRHGTMADYLRGDLQA
jgi:hypothetical protein